MSDREALGIHYIYGRLSADVLLRKKVIRSWEHPEPVLEEETLADLLSKIPGHLRFRGACASMIISSPAIDYQVIKIPAMTKRDLKQFLRWKAEASKGDQFAWSYTRLEKTKQEGSVYLHLVPAVYRAMFLKFCDVNQYDPLYLLTLASVAPDLLQSGEETGGKVEMIAAAVEQSTLLAVGTKIAPLFIREVPYSWNSPGENIVLQFVREIKRTIIFTRQQYRKEVVRLRLYGPEAEKTREAFADLAGISIGYNDGRTNWQERVHLSSPYRTDNLLPPEIIGQGPRRRRIVGIFAALCLTAAALIGAWIPLALHATRTDALVKKADLAGATAALQNEQLRLEGKKREIDLNRQQSKLMESRRLEPVPGWIALFAADALPNQLTITRFSVSRDDGAACWNVQIEGMGPASHLQAAKVLDRFQSRLAGDLTNLSPRDSWRLQWIENLKVSANGMDEGRPFRITGIVR